MSGRVALFGVLLVAVADRVTKALVTSNFVEGDSVVVIPGLLSLTYLRNPGAAFGLLAGAEPVVRQGFFILVTAVVVIALVWMLRARPRGQGSERVALVAILGGAFGNLYDRLTAGSVVDFVDLYVGAWHWPAFNLADSCITLGAAVLIFSARRTNRAAAR